MMAQMIAGRQHHGLRLPDVGEFFGDDDGIADNEDYDRQNADPVRGEIQLHGGPEVQWLFCGRRLLPMWLRHGYCVAVRAAFRCARLR